MHPLPGGARGGLEKSAFYVMLLVEVLMFI